MLRISGNVHFDNRALPNLHGIKRFEDAVFIFAGIITVLAYLYSSRVRLSSLLCLILPGWMKASLVYSGSSRTSRYLLDLADMLLSEAQVLSRSMNIRKVVELLS